MRLSRKVFRLRPFYRAVPPAIQIPNWNTNRFCTSHTECVTFLTVIKCHNFDFVTSIFAVVFFIYFFLIFLFTFAHKSQVATNSHVTGTVYKPISDSVFDWNGSEWMKYGKTYQKVSSVSVFCLDRNGSCSGTPSKRLLCPSFSFFLANTQINYWTNIISFVATHD